MRGNGGVDGQKQATSSLREQPSQGALMSVDRDSRASRMNSSRIHG